MNTNEQDLPELPDDAIERIEHDVFAELAQDRRAHARRRRRWVGGGLSAAAAVVVVAVVVTPALLQTVGGPDAGSTADSASVEESGSAEDAVAGGESSEEETPERRVIRTGDATIVVDDIRAASGDLSALAGELDGYIESMGSSSLDEEQGRAVDATSGWVTMRIPTDDLDGAGAALDDVGDVASIEISESDVTSKAIDLEARIDSLRASVKRLTELMDQAGSVDDLLEAEQALSERQSELESYERELEHLDDQVAMSTLHIELTRDREAASTDPAGFGDGLLTGWNGLIVFLNGLVVAMGFLLPWLGVLGAAGLIVWLIVRAIRRR